MSQYICWVREKKRVESLITLKDWTAEDADYQIHSTEIKHGLKSGNSSGKFHYRRSKSFGINQVDDKRKGKAKVCGECILSGIVMFLRVEVFRKNGPLQKS